MAAPEFYDQRLDMFDCGEKVRKLIDEAVVAEGVQLRVQQVDLFSKEFSDKTDALKSEAARSSLIEHAIRHEIHVKLEEDPVFYTSLRERLEQIVEDLKEKRIDEAKQLALFSELVGEMSNKAAAAQKLDLSQDAFAIYGILNGFRQQAGMLDRDIAARKLAEEQVNRLNESLARQNLALDAERMRWQGVVEGIADEVWVSDGQGKITLVNLPQVTATDIDASNGSGFKTFLENVEFLAADGSLRPFDQSPLLRAIRERQVVRGEELMRNLLTGALRHRQFTAAPMRDRAGELTGAVAVVRDITDLRLAACAMPTAARTSSWPCSRTSCPIRWPPSPPACEFPIACRRADRSRNAPAGSSIVRWRT